MLVTLIDSNDTGPTLLFLVICARGGNVTSWISLYASHPKMFPTLFGVTSMGICKIFAMSIVILAPIVAELEFRSSMTIFTILSFIAMLCSFFITEVGQEEAQKDEEKEAESLQLKVE